MDKSNYFQITLLDESDENIIDNITVQHFPNNYHFNTHMHRTAELIICTKGSCVITLHQNSIIIEPGYYIVIFPNTLHSTSTDVNCSNYCNIVHLHFHTNVFEDIIPYSNSKPNLSFLSELILGEKKFYKAKSSPALQNCIKSIYYEYSNRNENWKKMIDLSLSQLIIILSRDLDSKILFDGLYKNRHLINSTAYINKNYSKKLTVSKIAKKVGISERYLSKLFATYLGISVPAYITCVRIEKSIDIMIKNPNFPLTELAVDLGFSSLQYFSKCFKDKMGISPQKYKSDIYCEE